jgi:hypothetical protein
MDSGGGGGRPAERRAGALHRPTAARAYYELAQIKRLRGELDESTWLGQTISEPPRGIEPRTSHYEGVQGVLAGYGCASRRCRAAALTRVYTVGAGSSVTRRWHASSARLLRSAQAESVAAGGDGGDDAAVDEQVGAGDERAVLPIKNAAAVPISSGCRPGQQRRP